MIRPTEIAQDLASVRAAVAPARERLDARGQVSATSRQGAREPRLDAPDRIHSVACDAGERDMPKAESAGRVRGETASAGAA